MIAFSHGREWDTIRVHQVPETFELLNLALVGHLPHQSKGFSLDILWSTVAIERGRGERLISLSARDIENWDITSTLLKQVKRGRGPHTLDGDFFGTGPRPDCARVITPFDFLGNLNVTIGGGSLLIIDSMSAADLTIDVFDDARVELGHIYCTGKVTLRRHHNGQIRGQIVTGRALDIPNLEGIQIEQIMTTPGMLDVAGCPMELRYPDRPEYRWDPPARSQAEERTTG